METVSKENDQGKTCGHQFQAEQEACDQARARTKTDIRHIGIRDQGRIHIQTVGQNLGRIRRGECRVKEKRKSYQPTGLLHR